MNSFRFHRSTQNLIGIDLTGTRCHSLYGDQHHKTGVEMGGAYRASIAALTVYDMCKGLSHEIVIGEVRLLAKEGGKSSIGDAIAPVVYASFSPAVPAPACIATAALTIKGSISRSRFSSCEPTCPRSMYRCVQVKQHPRRRLP